MSLNDGVHVSQQGTDGRSTAGSSFSLLFFGETDLFWCLPKLPLGGPGEGSPSADGCRFKGAGSLRVGGAAAKGSALLDGGTRGPSALRDEVHVTVPSADPAARPALLVRKVRTVVAATRCYPTIAAACRKYHCTTG